MQEKSSIRDATQSKIGRTQKLCDFVTKLNSSISDLTNTLKNNNECDKTQIATTLRTQIVTKLEKLQLLLNLKPKL